MPKGSRWVNSPVFPVERLDLLQSCQSRPGEVFEGREDDSLSSPVAVLSPKRFSRQSPEPPGVPGVPGAPGGARSSLAASARTVV